MIRRRIPLLFVLGAALAASALAAAGAHAQSGVLTEPWWSIPGGGAAGITGGIYRLSGAAGAPAAAALSGGVYQVTAGFWTLPYGGAPTGVQEPDVPSRFALASIAPNPFATGTEIAFDLPGRDHVRIEVYDVRGSRVRTLVDESRDAGRYVDHWDGRDAAGRPLGSGVYFVRVNVTGRSATRRVVRLE